MNQMESHQGGHGPGEHGIHGDARGTGFVQPEEEAVQGNFTAVYNYLMGTHTEDKQTLLRGGRDKMTVNRHILQQGKFQFDISKKKATMSVVRHWNRGLEVWTFHCWKY